MKLECLSDLFAHFMSIAKIKRICGLLGGFTLKDPRSAFRIDGMINSQQHIFL